MRYSLVQAEQVRDDAVVRVDDLTMLVDKQIIDNEYDQLKIGYSTEKGFLIAADGEIFYSKKIVTRRPKAPTAVSKASSCKTSR